MQAVLISIHPGWCKEIFAFLGYDNRRPLSRSCLMNRDAVVAGNIYEHPFIMEVSR